MSTAPLMPERIGRFYVQSMLGRGAMGIVYLGHDQEIDRLVAIKLIRADLLDTEERESYLQRFRNEAKIAGRCMHANIVGLYDFAMHEDNPFLVLEYVNGVGLQQAYPRGSRRSVAEVLQIALQVLDALYYAHGRGIVHRDIKPANLLLTPDSRLKITDFGISRLTSMELTATPLLIGTPSYMSPEQCLGMELDNRSDLFSLGCVLYELLAGERPFGGINYTDIIFSIVNKPHRPLTSLRDDLPEGLSEAIDLALAKSPQDRHADAAVFTRAFDDLGRAAGVVPAGIPNVIVGTARVRAEPAPLEDPSLLTVVRAVPSPAAQAQAPLPDLDAAVEPDPDSTLVQRIAQPKISKPPGPGIGSRLAERVSETMLDRQAKPLGDVADGPMTAAEVASDVAHVSSASLAEDTPQAVAPLSAEVSGADSQPAPVSSEHLPAEHLVAEPPRAGPKAVPPLDETARRPPTVKPIPGSLDDTTCWPRDVSPAAMPYDEVTSAHGRPDDNAGSEGGPADLSSAEDELDTQTQGAEARDLAQPLAKRPPMLFTGETAARQSPAPVPFVPAPQMSGAHGSEVARLDGDSWTDLSHSRETLRDQPTSAPAATPVDEMERQRITRCLAEVVGPIAPLLVKRVDSLNLDMPSLIDQCAQFVRHSDERAQFLSLVSHGWPATAGHASHRLNFAASAGR